MAKDPWTDSDPQPGDFDDFLESLNPADVDVIRGNPDARLRILISVEGEDAERLSRISAARGEKPSELVAELLRDADRSAA